MELIYNKYGYIKFILIMAVTALFTKPDKVILMKYI